MPVHYTVSWDNRVGPGSDVHDSEAPLWTTVRRVRHTNHVILVIRTTGSHIGVVKNKVSWGTLMANNLITPQVSGFMMGTGDSGCLYLKKLTLLYSKVLN